MKRKTIRNHKDFIVSHDNPAVANQYFFTKAKPMAKSDARYGIIAPKRTFKLAVQRNRAKRLLRDWIAYNEDLMLPNLDYVFIARAAILDCTREIGRDKMANALKKISK
jgi:ribonuclease P protein component